MKVSRGQSLYYSHAMHDSLFHPALGNSNFDKRYIEQCFLRSLPISFIETPAMNINFS